MISNHEKCDVMEQPPKRRRQGKKPNCLTVVFGWFVKGMTCQGCLSRAGTGLPGIQEIPTVSGLLSFCLPASSLVCYHHMTTTARNSLLPLVSREVEERPRGRTSDAGQVQKTPLDSAVRNSVRFCMG